MKAIVYGLLIVPLASTSLWAQIGGPSLARVSLTLQQPAPVVATTEPAQVLPKKFGILTLVPPEGRGEFLRVSLPIGDLVSRAFKGAAAANHRRQETAARKEVAAALKRFEGLHKAPRR